MKKILLVILFAGLQLQTVGQLKLLQDLNPGGFSSSSSNPVQIKNIGSTLYFYAEDNVNGVQLWRSDGTEAGTAILNMVPLGRHGHDTLVVANNKLFFYGHGQALEAVWTSDGTNNGTKILKDDFGSFDQMGAVGSKIFFSAFNESHWSLWVSDGTTAGTKALKSVGQVNRDSLRNFIDVNGTLFFTADDGSHGRELWKSDGTVAGTMMVSDVTAGASGSKFSNFLAVKNLLYFVTKDIAHGAELWRSDGTSAGTFLVKDINAGAAGSDISTLYSFKDQVYFSATDGTSGQKLWTTTGAQNNATMITSATTETTYSFPAALSAARDTLFFLARSYSGISRIWKLDAKNNTARIVTKPDGNSDFLPDITALSTFRDSLFYFDIFGVHKNVGYDNYADQLILQRTSSVFPLQMIPTPQTFFMLVEDNNTGTELWRVGKNSAHIVRDINNGAYSSDPTAFVADGPHVYFIANAGSTPQPYLWVTDGTTTTQLQNQSGSFVTPTDLSLFAYHDKVVFTVNNSVWCSGSAARSAAAVTTSTSGRNFTAYNGDVYFFSAAGSSTQLWKTDCTSGGTGSVTSMGANFYTGMKELKGKLYFMDDKKLYISDGTAAGTSSIFTFSQGSPTQFIATDDKLMFVLRDNNSYFIGASDGTSGGTAVFSAGGQPEGLTPFKHSALFYMDHDMYTTNGTQASTTLLKKGGNETLAYGGGGVALNSNIIYAGADDVHASELWKTDGTVAGTTMIRNILPDITPQFGTAVNGSFPMQFQAIHNGVMFLASDGKNNTQLWKTDGTEGGTTKLTNSTDPIIKTWVDPGVRSFFYNNGITYVTASGSDVGVELYVYDSTVSGVPAKALAYVDAFPNPSRRFVFVDADDSFEDALVTVFTSAGYRLDIPVGRTERFTVVDFGDLPTGVYLIKVQGGGRSVVRRVILER